MSRTPNEPAFPSGGIVGMTLRDYFAAKAMEAILTNEKLLQSVLAVAQESGAEPGIGVAKTAYAYSDSMLKARDA